MRPCRCLQFFLMVIILAVVIIIILKVAGVGALRNVPVPLPSFQARPHSGWRARSPAGAHSCSVARLSVCHCLGCCLAGVARGGWQDGRARLCGAASAAGGLSCDLQRPARRVHGQQAAPAVHPLSCTARPSLHAGCAGSRAAACARARASENAQAHARGCSRDRNGGTA